MRRPHLDVPRPVALGLLVGQPPCVARSDPRSDLDLRTRVGVEVSWPRSVALFLTELLAAHNEALTVPYIDHRRRSLATRTASRRGEQHERRDRAGRGELSARDPVHHPI